MGMVRRAGRLQTSAQVGGALHTALRTAGAGQLRPAQPSTDQPLARTAPHPTAAQGFPFLPHFGLHQVQPSPSRPFPTFAFITIAKDAVAEA